MTHQTSAFSLVQELENRELIAQTTERNSFIEMLQKPISFYCGFDPTADSLHVGHLLLIIVSRHLQKAGHYPFFVVGGATGRIGDPSFKGKERALTSIDYLNECAEKLKAQFQHWFNFNDASNTAKFYNNIDWIQSLNVLVFLRDIGKHFSINTMLQKDAIKQRIERLESGISYTEFSYTLLQAYDYWHLYQTENVTLQLGGSDQWGNIVAGVNLIATKERHQVHGMTVPLITKSDGSKFGKTESGVIWLSSEKTSPYVFYQFWFNTPDDVVLSYLKKFTFLPLDDLKVYENLNQHEPNSAQKVLARWMTSWIHGAETTQEIEQINEALFQGKISQLSKKSLKMISTLPKITVYKNYSLIKALKETRLCASTQEAKRQIEQGAIYINDQRICIDYLDKMTHQLANGYTVIRRGKRNYALIEWSDDEVINAF